VTSASSGSRWELRCNSSACHATTESSSLIQVGEPPLLSVTLHSALGRGVLPWLFKIQIQKAGEPILADDRAAGVSLSTAPRTPGGRRGRVPLGFQRRVLASPCNFQADRASKYGKVVLVVGEREELTWLTRTRRLLLQ
jgi:hypothetical protein